MRRKRLDDLIEDVIEGRRPKVSFELPKKLNPVLAVLLCKLTSFARLSFDYMAIQKKLKKNPDLSYDDIEQIVSKLEGKKARVT